jgi:cytidyltransferase-like protein
LRIYRKAFLFCPKSLNSAKNESKENRMKITGIIAEYNPFHKGHLYQLKKIKKAFPETAIVIVMSGSFTQRGEVTILDKWCRARLAIEYGADLVLELPFVYAVRSAQDFASGAVRLLSYLGVQVLAFGAETDSLQICQEIALLQETKETQTILHQKIATGSSYAAALTQAILISSIHSSISSFLNSKTEQEITDLLHAPNTILAIEYLRAIHRYANQIKPFLIPRIGCGVSLQQTYNRPIPQCQWNSRRTFKEVSHRLGIAEKDSSSEDLFCTTLCISKASASFFHISFSAVL